MLKIIQVVLLLLLGSLECAAQDATLDFDKLQCNGLSSRSTKEQIVQKFGKPNKTVEPNYECGFFSSQEQGKKYYQLHYNKITFIGNTEEKYIIDCIKFDATSNLRVTYKDWKLSHKTSTSDMLKIFGSSIKFDKEENGIARAFIFFSSADDGFEFVFKNQQLVEINYWSPC